MTSVPARERLALPLDVADLDDARRWIELLREQVGVFKVGLELFAAAGPAAVKLVHDAGALSFLDLKLHDIPATVAGAVRVAGQLGVRYLTLHAAAGPRCIEAAAVAARGTGTRLLAVTVLTSMDDAEMHAVGLDGTPKSAVVRLGRLAINAGADGLVCSAEELGLVREACPAAELVVPGIRPTGAASHDQRRVATPGDAIRAGADLLVVGRPIREAESPVAAAEAVLAEIETAQAELRHTHRKMS